MAQESEAVNLEQALAHMAWLQGLARSLASNAADADDLVQETWLAALRHRPDAQRPLRPWLAHVLQNFARLRWRAEGRRAEREATAQDDLAAPPTPAQLVEETELQSRLAAFVVELSEPYRTTILLRYFRGLSAAEIARRESIPAATVRTRLARGLEMLRRRLDDAHGGNRAAWVAIVLPAAGATHHAGHPP